MPETPDFDQLAWCGNSVYHDEYPQGTYDDRCGACHRIKEQLRLVWNARGDADIAKVGETLWAEGSAKYVNALDYALRTLDR